MDKLIDYGVQEMNAEEMKRTNGGLLAAICFGIAAAIAVTGFIIAAHEDYEYWKDKGGNPMYN